MFSFSNNSHSSNVVAQAATGTRIDIGVKPNNQYNTSYLELQKNTTYTLYFWNPFPDAAYNLVIAVSGRNVTANTLYNNTDLVIGPTNYNSSSDYGGTGKFWTTQWTTPDNDTYIIYFCPFPGRYPTTLGIFVIGSPIYAPPIQIPSEGPATSKILINYLLVGSIILLAGVLIVVCLISYLKFKKLPSWQLITFFLAVIAIEIIFLIFANIESLSVMYF